MTSRYPTVASEARPRRPQIRGAEDVRLEVVLPVALDGEQRAAAFVRRGVHTVHRAALGHLGRSHFRPGVATVVGQVDPAVVGSGPQHPGHSGRFGQREDRPVHLDAGVVMLHRTARQRPLFGVAHGQVGRDGHPRQAAITGSMDVVGGVEHDLGVVPGHQNGSVPLETVVQVPRGHPVGHLGINDHVPGPGLLTVLPVDLPDVVPGVGQLGSARGHGDVAALAAGHVQPVGLGREAAVAPRGHADGRVVLLSSVEPPGELLIHGEPIELGGGLVADGGPVLAPVERDHRAPVVRLHHDPGVVRIDPQVVVVPVRNADGLERLAGVHRLQERSVEDVHRVRIRGVGDHVAVVPAARPEAAVPVHPRPGVPAVVAPVETAPLLRGGDERVHATGVRRRDGHPDAAHRGVLGSLRKPASNQFPRISPVPGSVEPALRAAVNEGPRFPLGLPHGGEQLPRIRRVHRKFHRSRRIGNLEHRGPGAPSILGAIDTPLR